MPQEIGSETGSLTAMAAPGRDAILARYRHLRAINRHHQQAALRFVPATALREQAQRLGLMARNTFVAESVAEITLAFDLSLYTAPPGRSCAMERYARSIRPLPGSDEDLMLQAMLRPRFSLFKVERPHETAGLVMNDLLRSENLWLMDESLERSAGVGVTFAMRLTQPEAFAMTCGVMVPVSRELWDAAYSELPGRLHRAPETFADDRRLATALYRHAVLGGLMKQVDFVHPTDQPDEDAT